MAQDSHEYRPYSGAESQREQPVRQAAASPVRGRALYVQYTNPAGYPPLEHSSRLLAEAGWRVRFLGTQLPEVSELRLRQHQHIELHLLAQAPGGWRQKIHYLLFLGWVLLSAARWRPTLVYASDLLACPPALLLSFLPRVRVLYHEHDSPEHGQGAARPSWFLRCAFWARARLADRAWRIVLPGQSRITNFIAETGIPRERTVSVWNCPAQEEIGPGRADAPGSTLRLIYHGSVVPSRLPETLVRAMAELPKHVSLTVVGYETVGHRGYIAHLLALAERLGVASQIAVAGTVPTRQELYALCRQADVGIALMPNQTLSHNERTMLSGPSNKIFDYLACGLAALVPDQAETRRLYVASGYAYPCDPMDVASIVAALRWYLDHPDKMRAMGERGRQRVLTEWNYEHQFAPVLKQLHVRQSSRP